MNGAPVLRVVGATMIFCSVSMLMPVMLTVSQGDGEIRKAFLASICVSGYFGVLFFLTTKGKSLTLGRRETVALLCLLAVFMTLIGGLPLYLGGNIPSFLDACFEALSGITTTGLSVLSDPTVLSDSELLWRAILQWMGGYGTLILVIWALPSFGFGGIFAPRRDALEVLSVDPQPSFQHVVRSLLLVYGGLTVICAISLSLAGMPVLDSICYSMSTVSTGGFVIESSGPVVLRGPEIQMILVMFMILGAINFTLHGRFIKGDWAAYSRDSESRMLVIFVLASIALIISADKNTAAGSFIISELFRFVSVITTTGYPGAEASNSSVNIFLLVLIFFAVIGGTTGSTAGGFKVMRLVLLMRQAKRELIQSIHPHAVVPIKFGRFAVTQSFIQVISVYFISYILCALFLAVALSAFDIDFGAVVILSISALTNSGPALMHLFDSNLNLFALPAGAKILIMIGMLLGRLEFLALIVLLNFSFWRP